MVKRSNQIKRIVQRYVEGLQQFIHVDKVILFGSYANGHPDEWSDIDLAIISRDFNGLNMMQRLAVMARARSYRDISIEALGYGKREYETANRQTFLGAIKRTGRVIYQARATTRRNQRTALRHRSAVK